MAKDPHFVALQNMYLAAPINDFFRPAIEVSDAEARIEIDVSEKLFHAAGAVHGSVYFKMLDDAAFFAVNSLVADVFVLTASFNVHLLRPVTAGELRAAGRVRHRSRRLFVGESELADGRGRLIASGSGTFVPSQIRLSEKLGYR